MGVEDLPSDAPRPRLCHLVKRADFAGYGFNLHAEKARPGQYIGTVDPDSPADLAGLKEGDRIVEVNGVNINQENHKQVVERIKSVGEETKLLVVDKETEEVYKRFSVVVKGSLPTVLTVESAPSNEEPTPPPLPTTPLPPDDEEDVEDHQARVVLAAAAASRPEDSHSVETPSNGQKSTTASESGSASPPARSFSPASATDGEVPDGGGHGTVVRVDSTSSWGGLNLNMTAKEMREVIGSKKKRDPRKDDRLDFHKKYEIIQTL